MIRKKIIVLGLLLAAALVCAAAPAIGDTRIAYDPAAIGVGARVLGMGKSFVGLSDDLLSLFINPAGLASVKDPQFTTLSGKFINEYNYLNLGVAIPLSVGTLGLGYVGSNISFIGVNGVTEVVDGIVRVIPSTSEGSSYSFDNRVLLLSLGSRLGGDWSDLSVGASLKLFLLDLAGPGIVGGRGVGNNLDLGIHYAPEGIFQGGLTLLNALPEGKIRYDSNSEESLQPLLKAGISLRLLGENAWKKAGAQKLVLNLDNDFYFNQANLPSLTHIGLEWSPLELIDLRAGVDQDIVGTGGTTISQINNNLTTGVGLHFGDFRFDYAFHQYSSLSEDNTHYFSITYGARKQPARPAAKRPQNFIVKPDDKTIIYGKNVIVAGEVFNDKVYSLLINGASTTLFNRSFNAGVALKPGRNRVELTGTDDRGQTVDALTIRLLSLPSFNDVPTRYWAVRPIGLLSALGVINGYPGGDFKPEGAITRAELCALLMKSQNESFLTPNSLLRTPNSFKDVPAKHWAADHIARALDLGLVKGYPGNRFKPNAPISRSEGVVILARFGRLPDAKSLTPPFADVPGRFWAFPEISAANEAGLLDFISGQQFRPKQTLTRAEAAEMLAKLPPFTQRMKALLDWDRAEEETLAKVEPIAMIMVEPELTGKVTVTEESEAIEPVKAAEVETVEPEVIRPVPEPVISPPTEAPPAIVETVPFMPEEEKPAKVEPVKAAEVEVAEPAKIETLPEPIVVQPEEAAPAAAEKTVTVEPEAPKPVTAGAVKAVEPEEIKPVTETAAAITVEVVPVAAASAAEAGQGLAKEEILAIISELVSGETVTIPPVKAEAVETFEPVKTKPLPVEEITALMPKAVAPFEVAEIDLGKPVEVKPVRMEKADGPEEEALSEIEEVAAPKPKRVSRKVKPEKPRKKFRPPVLTILPGDKQIVFANSITFEGRVIDRKVYKIYLNKAAVVRRHGEFRLTVPLVPGKNSIVLKAYDVDGELLEHRQFRVLALRTCPDIVPGHWAKTQIGLVTTLGIMKVYSDGSFRPNLEVGRADYLINLLEVSKIPAARPSRLPFVDVAKSNPVAPAVQAGYNRKIVKGYPDKTFRPERETTRAEGVVMLTRLARQRLLHAKERPYADVPTGHWAVKEITVAKQTGLLKHVLVNLYPSRPISRLEAAIMLTGIAPVKARIRALLDWETGYRQ